MKADTLTLGAKRKRAGISAAKKPFLDAIRRVIDEPEKILAPVRPQGPLRPAERPALNPRGEAETMGGKPRKLTHNRYRNDRESYKAVCELLTRARLTGLVPFNAIGDETRPVTDLERLPERRAVLPSGQVEGFGTGYWRDLMQSQPNHIEIVGEKMTIEGIVRPVAAKYCVPYTIGRGYSSLPPRKDMFDRFKESGKSRLVILFMSDHDPEGWDIARTFAKSMRDDFGVEMLTPSRWD